MAPKDTLVLDELAVAVEPELVAHEDELSAYSRGFLEEMRERETDLERAVRASTRLVELARRFDDWLDEHPLAVCPVAPTPAAPLGEGITEVDGEPARPGGKLTLCSIANTLGLPAASVPVMRSQQGLPVGAQLLGQRGHDAHVIAAARELERAFGGFLDPDEAPRSATRAQASEA
jgi:Asp-tRNA(Asn)/Glu-tRNA(Gln) amidotransferase A subunit family amidase